MISQNLIVVILIAVCVVIAIRACLLQRSGSKMPMQATQSYQHAPPLYASPLYSQSPLPYFGHYMNQQYPSQLQHSQPCQNKQQRSLRCPLSQKQAPMSYIPFGDLASIESLSKQLSRVQRLQERKQELINQKPIEESIIIMTDSPMPAIRKDMSASEDILSQEVPQTKFIFSDSLPEARHDASDISTDYNIKNEDSERTQYVFTFATEN